MFTQSLRLHPNFFFSSVWWAPGHPPPSLPPPSPVICWPTGTRGLCCFDCWRMEGEWSGQQEAAVAAGLESIRCSSCTWLLFPPSPPLTSPFPWNQASPLPSSFRAQPPISKALPWSPHHLWGELGAGLCTCLDLSRHHWLSVLSSRGRGRG